MNTHWYRDYEIDCDVKKNGTSGTKNVCQGRYGLRSGTRAEWKYVDIELSASTIASARQKCLQHAKAEIDLLVGPERYAPPGQERHI